MLKIDTPDSKKPLASQSLQRYNTPNLNMKKSPSEQAAAVIPRLVKKGSLTTCLTTDSVGAHSDHFSAFLVLFLRFGRLLFRGGFRGKKWWEYERLEQPNP